MSYQRPDHGVPHVNCRCTIGDLDLGRWTDVDQPVPNQADLEAMSGEQYVAELRHAHEEGKKDGAKGMADKAMLNDNRVADDIRRAYFKGWNESAPLPSDEVLKR